MHRMACGYRVFVCSNMAFCREFTPVLAKHTKSFNLIDTLAVGVDRIQRSFEPMRRQVEADLLRGIRRRKARCPEESTGRRSPVVL
jgi:hypothetical protein